MRWVTELSLTDTLICPALPCPALPIMLNKYNFSSSPTCHRAVSVLPEILDGVDEKCTLMTCLFELLLLHYKGNEENVRNIPCKLVLSSEN
ncbi:hypothetical protein E2C01_025097 [Portunus trituberculatus]|uniref:Uncharacterized protein n=1 Tax=Portunus trituberculatus TaxID=210409 RepID=A0A5B7EC44_PORTR|nr:hypothetical protein [Portunus trituberculatus]